MISSIADNLGTIVAVVILAAVIALALTAVIRDKKAGKSSCGCGCAHCSMAGTCHKPK